MSTPTTATATIPHSHYHNSHHHFPYYPGNSAASYRSAAHQLLPSTSRLAHPPPYSASSASYAPSTTTQATSTNINGSTYSNNSSVARSHRTDLDLPSILDQNYTTMPAASSKAQHSTSAERKRRRESPVDWNKFYGGQPPKEIIVIDDTPEPEGAAAPSASQHSVNSSTAYSYTNGLNGVNGGGGAVSVAANTSATRHAPKRRKGNDDAPTNSGTRYDPVHHSRLNGPPLATTTPRQNGTPAGSTISSSDRTNSAIHTTAATSLGSLSSNGQHDYDAQPGQKRKRTRQQVANEIKRRETEIIGHAFPSYHPPPQPPKKAGDVHVRLIPDVSSCPPIHVQRGLTYPCYSRRTKVAKSMIVMVTTLWCRMQNLPRTVSYLLPFGPKLSVADSSRQNDQDAGSRNFRQSRPGS